jgi:CAI-1 autoinducer synthase
VSGDCFKEERSMATSGQDARHPLPDFMEQRLTRFYEGRFKEEWGGRHVFRSRLPAPGSLILCNNDYLDIARHPRLIEAQCTSLKRSGAGLMMSTLFDQDPDGAKRRVEDSLARVIGGAEGVLTQSGYCANIGLIQAIAGPEVPVYVDSMAHASLHAGIRFAGAVPVPFKHNDIVDLAAKMSQKTPGVVAIDSVYSTDGSVAPMAAIARLTKEHGSVLVVDESHSFGTHGTHGCGLVASLGLMDKVHFITVSLAKAYCSRAGFIACPRGFRDYFGFESLPAIFSSALLPHDIAGIDAARQIAVEEDGRRERLHDLTRQARQELGAMGYPVGTEGEQIIALEVGSDFDAAAVRDRFEDHGIFGALFTPPATSRGRSLVRLSLHAGLSDADVERLLGTLRDLRETLNLAGWSGSRRRSERKIL